MSGINSGEDPNQNISDFLANTDEQPRPVLLRRQDSVSKDPTIKPSKPIDPDNSFPVQIINKDFMKKYMLLYKKEHKSLDQLEPGKKYYILHRNPEADKPIEGRQEPLTFWDYLYQQVPIHYMDDPKSEKILSMPRYNTLHDEKLVLLDNLAELEKRNTKSIPNTTEDEKIQAERIFAEREKEAEEIHKRLETIETKMNEIKLRPWSRIPKQGDRTCQLSRYEEYILSATYLGEQAVKTYYQKNAEEFPSAEEWTNLEDYVKEQLLAGIGIFHWDENFNNYKYPNEKIVEIINSIETDEIDESGKYKVFENMKFEAGIIKSTFHFEGDVRVYRGEDNPDTIYRGPALQPGRMPRKFEDMLTSYPFVESDFVNEDGSQASDRYQAINKLTRLLKKPNGIEEPVYCATEPFNQPVFIEFEETTVFKKQKFGGSRKRKTKRKNHRRRTNRRNRKN